MANNITGNPLYIDTEGIISVAPLRIQKIILKPNATGDAATFVYWDESDDPVTTYGTRDNKTVTVTAATGTIVSTANFETDSINADQIIKIVASTTGENQGRWQIATNADDNTITVDGPAARPFGQSLAAMTDDAAQIYSWRVWDTRKLITIKGSGVTSDTGLVQVPFEERGFWVPNLAMNTLSANAVLYIYLKN